jgi:hypothetical protein
MANGSMDERRPMVGHEKNRSVTDGRLASRFAVVRHCALEQNAGSRT